MKIAALLLSTVLLTGTGVASTVVTATPSDAGIPYRHTISMSGHDSAAASRHVGAWSWEDNSLFNAANGEPPVGWTHTSDWVALTLLEPAQLTLRLERQAGVPNPTPQNPGAVAGVTSMFPSFTIYSGWDTDGAQNDTYNNRGAISWAGVTYMDHVDNSTETLVERTWTLAAGNYTLALGSNAPANDTTRQGYLLSLTTVPEPGVFGLGLAALTVIAGGRRRRPGMKS